LNYVDLRSCTQHQGCLRIHQAAQVAEASRRAKRLLP
jgi:hypothetical protein